MPNAVSRVRRRAPQRLRSMLSGLSRVGLTAYLVPLCVVALALAYRPDILTPGERRTATQPPGAPGFGPAPSPPGSSRQVVGMARVLDGDTLDLAGQRIRLHGIDAPESRQICQRQGRSYGCGQEAQRWLSAAIAGREVRCTGQNPDGHGRLVAVCRAGGVDLADAMVRGGWALAYRRYASDYVGAEGAARARGSGLWAGPFETPEDWRRTHGRD